jgi:ubiquinone/menaquinone biosynthesis C-methylase UbiE
MVKELVLAHDLNNVQTIQSDCQTGLPEQSVDAVLLYDTLHDLKDQAKVLEELHRIMRPEGILSVSDHHLKQSKIAMLITQTGLFSLVKQGKKTITFQKLR